MASLWPQHHSCTARNAASWLTDMPHTEIRAGWNAQLTETRGLGLGVPARLPGEVHSGPETEPMLSTQSSGMPGEAMRCTGGGVVGGVGAAEPPWERSTGSHESLTCMDTGTCVHTGHQGSGLGHLCGRVLWWRAIGDGGETELLSE